MRLINNETMVMEEFMGSGSHVPPYAILSHTWEDGETTFQDFTNVDTQVRSSKKGFLKIEKACELAKEAGLKYTWVDTCCIDKTSSAELTEAINSMFHWYKDAVVCHAWLADLVFPPERALEPATAIDLEKCRWFTRGWTLQELIAPRVVEFFDKGWNPCGTKATLSAVLSEIVQISADVLKDPGQLPRLSVAQRMSWVARRQTTRVEDMAYCMLGIFDVNMPMLYGEGERAFLRLQEEIVKESNDLSLFAWRTSPEDLQTYRGVFASTPSFFRDSGSVQLTSNTVHNPQFALTNKGLHITTNLHPGATDAFVFKLNCSLKTDNKKPQPVGIWIQQHGGGVYGRTDSHSFGSPISLEASKHHEVFLSRRISAAQSTVMESSHRHAFMLRKGFNDADVIHDPDFPFRATRIAPKDQWNARRRMFLTQGAGSFVASIFFFWRAGSAFQEKLEQNSSFVVVFGLVEGEEDPWITVASAVDGADIIKNIGNEQLVTKLALQRRHLRQATMLEKTKAPSATIEEAMVDGEVVWAIDISYGDVEPAGKAEIKKNGT